MKMGSRFKSTVKIDGSDEELLDAYTASNTVQLQKKISRTV